MFQSRPSAREVTRRARKPLVGLVAVVAVASLGTGSTPGLVTVAESELPVSPGDRVLQSVEVAMGPDGTLTAVEGTTVTASADGEGADSTTQAYSPDDVVGDLPVRVLTSYRTADGTGSDLSDLEGYDGEVQIDLTVQNLTVQAEDLSYDVPGGSRTRPALVGAPLTIVAAADLGATDPATVVTQRAGEDTVTNGVLSQGADGATRVQWATILAPPQLSSSATLSLVVDAKDFSAPAFDLSVQPGLVTDPSVGALVENAFNPAASEELVLQQKTVEVVGEVNEVLAEAGDSIAEVRSSLNSTTETLGVQTVDDLKSSITGIAASMEALDGTVTGLGEGISTALESTGSSSLTQLESTVSSVDSLLGDTKGTPGTATVSGVGCRTTVSTGTGAGSVYDSLLRVAGTLNGYADASDECKVTLRNSILTSIGPADTDDCTPDSADSVTCVLDRTRKQLPAQISEALADSEKLALDTLEATGLASVMTQMNELNRVLDGVESVDGEPRVIGVIEALKDLEAENAKDGDLGEARAALVRLGGVDSPNGIRRELEAVAVSLGDSEAALETLEAIADRDRLVYGKLCAIVYDPATAAAVVQVQDAAVTLMGVPCPPRDVDPTEPPPELDPDLISPQVKAAKDDITAFIEAARTDLESALGEFDDQYDITLAKLDAATTDDGSLKGSLKAFFVQIKKLDAERIDVRDAVEALNGKQELARKAIVTAFENAGTSAAESVRDGTQESIDEVSKRSAAARDAVTDAFNRSKVGMRAAADGIAADGRAAIEEQKAGLDKVSKAGTSEIESNVSKGLDVIADSVSASTRDTDAAGKLLTADLTKVLLDLGDPKIDGAGLLGTLGANAGDARAADFQLALAARTASSYANARGQDIGGLMLRQAQAEAAFKRQAQLQAFQVDVPDGVERRTVYSFHLAPGQ